MATATDFQPLHNETHKDVKIKRVTEVADLKDQHALGLVVQEFARAAAEFPVVFIKDGQSERFFPIAMMGIKQNENLFVTDENKWDAGYMPARYTHKPLSVIPHKDDENKFAIAIDMASPLISKDGDALFKEDGSEAEHLENRKKSLMAYIEHEKITSAFIDTISKLELIEPRNLKVNVGEKEINLNGLYMVDEKKLNELSDEVYLDLRKRGYLAPIYSHLGSIHQLNNLLKREAATMAADAK